MKKIEQTIRKAYSHPRVRVVNLTPNSLLSGSVNNYDDELGAKNGRYWFNYEDDEWYEDE